MKSFHILTLAIFLAACSPSPAPNPTTSAAGSESAMATGVVKGVDAAAGTITIDHGPVEALNWPAMTMTFKAPAVDLQSVKPGDHVRFQPTADGTIARLERE